MVIKMISNKRAIIIVERDFQDLEVFYPYYRLIEEGVVVKVAGTGEKAYTGKFGLSINTDGEIADFTPNDFSAVIIPGGWAPDYMRRYPAVIEFVRKMNDKGRVVASICHGAWLLASANIVKGKKLTCFFAIKDDLINAGAEYVDKSVVVDGNIITSRKPDDLPDFLREIIKKINTLLFV